MASWSSAVRKRHFGFSGTRAFVQLSLACAEREKGAEPSTQASCFLQ